MPHESSYGPVGTVIPAWVCCQYDSAAASAGSLGIDHGCCAPGRFNRPCDNLAGWPVWALSVANAWVPELPAGAVAVAS